MSPTLLRLFNTKRLGANHANAVRLALRMAFIMAVILPIRPPQRIVYLGAPQTVATVKPHVCVHTLLENEVDEWKIKHSLELTREMGAATIVQFFPWAYVQPRESAFDWEQADRIVRHAANQGLRIIARLGLVPAWARTTGAPTTLNTLPEASFDDFAEYASRFASRYAGHIQHIIIWNEPNLSFEWGYQPVDAAVYARLLKVSYRGIKAANPKAVVLAGALAPTNEPRGSSAGLNEMDFLRDLYSHGASDYFDALAIHSYGHIHPPEAEPSRDLLNFRRLEYLREIMIAFGDGAKPAFITESGWNDHPRWVNAVRPSQRLQYTIRAFEYAKDHWDWVDALCIWALRYPRPVRGYPDNFTLIGADFDVKPIYFAVQDYARGWDASPSQWLPPPEES